ncbi:alpha/beta fold hydrolase [Umezawaea beigongshangensis]|uniref:alpha/beta fold hydrolase n=1 Tax=Umezawaea beigongshangensis TaxID=2780383 RepID=UPI0027DE46B4|nr:alpha/beta hydrolase [Umezawaea beigongshangensis]
MTALASGLLWRAHGRGTPVTLVAHGLGATPGEARLPASGLPGTRVVVTLPSHGDAPDAPPDYWSYRGIAADLRHVAQEVGATRAIGVSLGAGALTALVADVPDAFERLALLLPAALDRPRDGSVHSRLLAVLDDPGALEALVAADLPGGVDAGDHPRARAAALTRLRDALVALPGDVPVPDPAVLSRVAAPVLVVGATADPVHPEGVARAVAAAFPRGELDLVPSAAPLLTHRPAVRERLVAFFTGV